VRHECKSKRKGTHEIGIVLKTKWLTMKNIEHEKLKLNFIESLTWLYQFYVKVLPSLYRNFLAIQN
jgi:hypothetical protein